MKFLADENIPLASVLVLRDKGIDITYIGVDDPSIADKKIVEIEFTFSLTKFDDGW